MKEQKLFIGEDFSLWAEVLFNEEHPEDSSIEHYRIDIELSTTPLGAKIVASTESESRSQVEVMYKGTHEFGLNVPAELTATLTAGVVTMGVVITHRESGLKSIVEQSVFTLVESRIGRSQSIKNRKTGE